METRKRTPHWRIIDVRDIIVKVRWNVLDSLYLVFFLFLVLVFFFPSVSFDESVLLRQPDGFFLRFIPPQTNHPSSDSVHVTRITPALYSGTKGKNTL